MTYALIYLRGRKEVYDDLKRFSKGNISGVYSYIIIYYSSPIS